MIARRELDVKLDSVSAQAQPPHRPDQLKHLHDVRVLEAELLELVRGAFVEELECFSAELLELGHSQVETVCVAENHAEDALVRQRPHQLVLVVK